MKLRELIKEFELSPRCKEELLEKEVLGGYCGDLLSDVIANCKAGFVWITMQVHLNIVAVATLKEISAIILVNGREPNEDTLRKANEENIPILVSKLSSFELAGRLYSIGVGKK